MGRMTRAKAAAIAEEMHVDHDVLLEQQLHSDDPVTLNPALITPTRAEERPVLGELSPNSAGSVHTDRDDSIHTTESMAELATSGRDDSGSARGAANSPGSLDKASTPAMLADDIKFAGSPASKAASDNSMRDDSELEISHLPFHDIRPKSPLSNAVRHTGTQPLEIDEREPQQLAVTEDCEPKQHYQTAAKVTVDESAQCDSTTPLTAMPNVLQHSVSSDSEDVTSGAQGIDQTTYDLLEAAAVEAQTPPKANIAPDSVASDYPNSPMENISDAVEKLISGVPEDQPLSEKSTSRKSSAPIVRMSKAALARISMAQGKDFPKAPDMDRSRASTVGITRTRRDTVISSEKLSDEAARKDENVPHSKPRPKSMHFPQPKQPTKSSKAPTQSTFRLPGEEVAAKLKAAREARLAKEAEDQQKKGFKARPAPTATKAPVIRQTSTSKARQSIAGGEDPKPKVFKARPAPTSTKAPEVRQTSASKARLSMISSRPDNASGTLKRANSVASGRPSLAKTSATPARSLTVTRQRSATSMANATKPRSSMAPGAAISAAPKPKTAVSTSERPNYLSSSSTAVNSLAKSKGKEVFNRTANAKVSAEQQKREKEEAAKKARVEAAERSRQLSREWAEKQKARKASNKP